MEWLSENAIYFALFFSLVLLVQFFMSIIGFDSGDADIDADVPGEGMGFGLSDIVSFKGLIHFLLGFFWSLTIIKTDSAIERTAWSVGFGILFLVTLAYCYKLLFKLSEERKETDLVKELTGKIATVYSWNNEHGMVVAYHNSTRYEFSALFKDTPDSYEKFLVNGDTVRIKEFLNDKRYVYIEVLPSYVPTLKHREAQLRLDSENRKSDIANNEAEKSVKSTIKKHAPRKPRKKASSQEN